MQNSAANRQCERNATNRAVSSRCDPRSTRFTAAARLSYRSAVEDAPEVPERQLVRLQERLLGRVAVGPMERAAAGHAPQAEHLQLHPLAVQVGHRLVPVDLRLAAPRVALRHERLARQPAPAAAFRSRTYCRTVDSAIGCPGRSCPEPHVDPPRRVPLLPRRPPIGLQDRVDEPDHRLQPWPGSWRRRLLRSARASFSASRTSRRCTPNFRATPWIVPIPNSYSRRISSNSSTVAFLRRMPPPPPARLVQGGERRHAITGGPFPSIEVGQTRISNTPPSRLEPMAAPRQTERAFEASPAC